MLVLSRRLGEKIQIADNIVITVVEIVSDSKVRLGIEAPREVPIMREELLSKPIVTSVDDIP